MPASELTAIGTSLPLVFTFRRTLFGNGFVVEVKVVNGRALCVHEDDGVWIYGINPGGMAASGEDADAARTEFGNAFSNILQDLVLEATSFSQFQEVVRRFFEETNTGYESDWQEAVRAVRAHHLSIADLPTGSADAPRSVSVELKHAFQAADNSVDLEPALAA